MPARNASHSEAGGEYRTSKMQIKDFIIKHKFVLLLLIPLALYFVFGLHHLTQFETADEHYWYMNPLEGRIHEYWRAMLKGDLESTYVNDKPGITLAYVSGIGMLFQGDPEERIVERGPFYRIFNPAKTEHNNLVFRLPLLIFNGLFVFYFLWALRKLTDNDWLSLLAATLILLNPILIGISQIVNPDSLLWTFSFAALLSFMLYLTKERKRDLILTALFTGLALLSKYAAVILFPFFLAVLAFHFLVNFEQWGAANLRQKVLQFFFAFWVIVVEALTLFAFLMPAVLVRPKLIYAATIGFKGAKP
ncbi:phospholipid carrier-dependent glycosyltransferase, partial [Patescibacteria group bacterium]